MNQDIFRSVVHRSLSKSLKSTERERSPNHESDQFGSIVPNKNYTTPFSLSIEVSTHEKSKEKREKEKVKAMALRGRTELQIPKTYGGSISKNGANNFGGFSRNFAENLLRGAIDLQESINMLESFQANVNKKKRKPKNEEEIQEVLMEGYNSKRFISNGSSKNNLEGLKKVIKESLYKQNLIMDSLDDGSSSSSRSFNGINYCNNNNNSRGIVAKLMGLGEVPMDLENYQRNKKDTNMKSLTSTRAFFDLEKMPRVRKENLFEEKIDPNQKALEEIMETMQFKGLMRNNQAEKMEFDAILVKEEDQSAKLVSKEKKPENDKMIRTREKMKEVKSNEVKFKTETSKNVKNNHMRKPSVERKPESSIKKKSKEKKGLNANLPASKTIQKSERKIVGTSDGIASTYVANRVATNSNVSVKEKNAMVIKKPRSSNVNVADKRIKREMREIMPKKQKINGVKTNLSILPNERNSKKKKPEISPSVEDDWSVSFEASPLSTTSHSFKQEEEEFINFSPKKEINIRLLLLGDKSFIEVANELGRGKIEDLKLCLDIAEEQILRKRLNFDLFYPPYQIQGIKSFYSVEKSIGDITNGIRKLNGYTNLKKNGTLKDSLYLKLERDLSCKDEGINSIWDLGWMDWICAEEASNVVCDFSDYILSLLIEEVSLDLFM